MTGFGPGPVPGQAERQREQGSVPSGADGYVRPVEHQRGTSTGLHRPDGDLAGADRLVVDGDLPDADEVAQVGVVTAVLDLAPPEVGDVGPVHGDRFEHLLQLGQRRFERAVGEHQAVVGERSVVGLVTEVAAVGPEAAPVGQWPTQALVDPVPHEAASQAGMPANGVPVLDEVAGGVAHRVRVLAHDHRPVVDPIRFGDERVDARVHRSDHVDARCVAGRVVVDGTTRIVAVHPGRRRVVGGPVAALVAERPDDHARVVAISRRPCG